MNSVRPVLISAGIWVSRPTRATEYRARLKTPSTRASAIRPFSRLIWSMAMRRGSPLRVGDLGGQRPEPFEGLRPQHRGEAGRVGLGEIERLGHPLGVAPRAARQVGEDLRREPIDLLGERAGAGQGLHLRSDIRGIGIR